MCVCVCLAFCFQASGLQLSPGLCDTVVFEPVNSCFSLSQEHIKFSRSASISFHKHSLLSISHLAPFVFSRNEGLVFLKRNRFSAFRRPRRSPVKYSCKCREPVPLKSPALSNQAHCAFYKPFDVFNRSCTFAVIYIFSTTTHSFTGIPSFTCVPGEGRTH